MNLFEVKNTNNGKMDGDNKRTERRDSKRRRHVRNRRYYRSRRNTKIGTQKQEKFKWKQNIKRSLEERKQNTKKIRHVINESYNNVLKENEFQISGDKHWQYRYTERG